MTRDDKIIEQAALKARDLLAKATEKAEALLQKQADDATNLRLLANDTTYIKESVKKIEDKLEKEYVTKDQFDPVRNIVYGLVTIILTGVIGALLYLVLNNSK